MSQTAMIVGIISLLMSLFLAVRAFRSHGLAFETRAWMAAAWAVIITVLAFVMGRLG